MRKLTAITLTVFSVFSLALLYACAPQKPLLEQVKQQGVIRVVTRNAPTTYYQSAHGPAGLEYDLVKAFAEHLGVKIEIVVNDRLKNILDMVNEGKVHFAAAGLTVTEERQQVVRFTPSYQEITQQLVYHHSNSKPKSILDLNDGVLEVIANSSHANQLALLKTTHPDLNWTENEEASSSELLSLVAEQLIDHTVADSNEVLLTRRFHPELQVAFDVSEKQPLAWAFSKHHDDSLYYEASQFIEKIRASGQLARLIKRNYGHARNYDFAGTATYLGHVRYRLPRYQTLFEKAAQQHNLDWKLLAALAYQESHWNPRAVSPTGVRGIMMLTQSTASSLGIADRTDPIESIEGGARYLREIYDSLPAEVADPDRLWMTLASYNVGIGHMSDAMQLTRIRGGNPLKWVDVKETLPLLRQRKWHRKTKYGYARGDEPVKYVENIRTYFDVLRWHLVKEKQDKQGVVALASPVL